MSQPIKLIIFDLDGTLVDAFRAVTMSLNYALKEIGMKPLKHEYIKKRVGWGEKVLVKSFVDQKHLPDALRIYRAHHKKALLTGVKFLPGARKTLDRLKAQGYKLAIASNRPSFFTNIILKRLEINRHFVKVHCADQAARPKPYGHMLRDILAEYGYRPREAIYVGDMVVDCITGRRARVKTIAVTTGSSTARELSREKPYKIIRRIKELGPIVDALNG